MASARERLRDVNERSRSSMFGEQETALPANYSQIIKAAQAEERQARGASAKPSASSTSQSRNPNSGTRPSGKPRIPTPSSADDARIQQNGVENAPIPTSRDAQTGEAGSDNTLLGILAAALGAGGAYALYKRLSRGDQDAMNEARTILTEQGIRDATPAAEKGDRIGIADTKRLPAPDSARFGDDIVDAEYEDVSDRRQLRGLASIDGDVSGDAAQSSSAQAQSQSIEQERGPQRLLESPDPRASLDNYLDVLDVETGMIDADQQARAAVEGEEAPRQIAPPAGEAPADEDIDAIVRQAIEEGTMADRGGRLKRVPTSQTPSPNIKPRVRPRT